MLLLRILHANGAAPLRENARGLRLRNHGEVRAVDRGAQIAHRGAGAASARNCAVHRPEAFLLCSVEIGCVRVARLLPGLDPRYVERVRDAGPCHLQRTVAAVKFVRAVEIALGFLEIGQNVFPGPAPVSELRPEVIVARNAADIDHGVHRARSAENLSARPVQAASAHPRLRLGVVAPVDPAGFHERRVAHGHVNKEILVARAGFQKRHFDGGVGRKAVREHASSGTAAHNDVIVCHEILRPRPFLSYLGETAGFEKIRRMSHVSKRNAARFRKTVSPRPSMSFFTKDKFILSEYNRTCLFGVRVA